VHQIRVHLQYLGFPIIGDNIYDSDAFGLLKGKGGDYGGKTNEEVIITPFNLRYPF
jgi:23S rRNA-/tRNA-specific pseudouridylate synthase